MWYPLSLVVWFTFILADSSCDANRNSTSTFKELRDTDFPKPWVSDLFYQAFANFTPRNVGSEACRKQTEMYEKFLRNHTSWAIKMAESWNRYPVGISEGVTYQMGIYDECVKVQYPVRGQYCLTEIKLNPPTGKDYSFNRTEYQDYFGKQNAWHTILGWADHRDQISRNILNIGICIPDSCSATDLETSLQKQLNSMFNPEQLSATVKVDPVLCSNSDDKYLRNTAYYVTCFILAVLVFICCTSTLYSLIILTYHHSKQETYELSNSVFNAFSFIKSGKELISYRKNSELNVLSGLKVLVMIIILFGHEFMYFTGSPSTYPKTLEEVYLYGPSILLTGMNMVDPFFFISAYLMYIIVTPKINKAAKAWNELVLQCLRRITRMLPAYCAMIVITAHIVPHLGDGPLWSKQIWEEAEICKNYWWLNVLFVNNLIDLKYQCMLVSWYIPCDIHFFILGGIILYIYTKNTKYGIGILCATIVTSICIPIIFTLLTAGDGIFKIDLATLKNLRTSAFLNESYRASFNRATPFLSGLATGIIVKKLKEIKFKLSQTAVFGGTFIAFAIGLWIQMYGMIFYKRGRPYYLLENAFYSSICHCTYAMICMWIFICIFTTGYGPITKLFNNRIVSTLGNLSYSVLLVNLTIMSMSASSLKSPIQPSVQNILSAMITETFKCYFMALLLYLMVESPFRNLTDRLFVQRQKKIESNRNEVQLEKAMGVAENPLRERIN